MNAVSAETLRESYNLIKNVTLFDNLTHTSKFIKIIKGGNTFICDKLEGAHKNTI